MAVTAQRISYSDKEYQRVLLHSGSSLASMGIMSLGAALGLNNGAELLLTASFVSVWAALTGVFGIYSSCWYPNNHDYLECDTDIGKRKKTILVRFKIYLGAVLTEICATIVLIAQATVIGNQNLWNEDTTLEYMWVLVGISILFISFLVACRMAYNIRDFTKHHNREHDRASTRTREVVSIVNSHPVSVNDVVSDNETLPDPPPYSQQSHFSSTWPPTYETVEAEQPFLPSILAGTANNGRSDGLPPSYSQVMDSNV